MGEAIGDSCEVCGSTEVLEEHHTQYRPAKTVDVCSSCHRKIHQTDGFRDDLQPDRPRSKHYTGEVPKAEDVEATCRADGSVCELVGDGDTVSVCVFCGRVFNDRGTPIAPVKEDLNTEEEQQKLV